MISTVAGAYNDQGTKGDGGPAEKASLYGPEDIALANDGTFYIADANTVRKIAPDGTISRFAGTGTKGAGGDRGPATQAQLDAPEGVAIGPDGAVYIADSGNNLIRRVGTDGVITRVAGTTRGYEDDDGPALETKLSDVSEVAVDGSGAVYLTDYYGGRIRRVTPNGAIIDTILTKAG
jgi:serine/threonine-protein kinase